MNFKTKTTKTSKPLTREEELLKELNILRAENEILKVQCLSQERTSQENKGSNHNGITGI
jgi:hypothetical protein